MVTWSDVQQWKSASLDALVDGLVSHRRAAYALAEDVEGINRGVSWSGKGKQSADDAITGLRGMADRTLTEIGEALTATAAAQDGLGEVETLVYEALTRASEYGFTIAADGSQVSDPTPIEIPKPRSPMEPPTAREIALFNENNDRVNRLNECAKAVENALNKANEVDATFAAALTAIGNGSTRVDPKDSTPGLLDFPEGQSTEVVAAWWAALSDAEREAIKNDPDLYRALGNIDGIPMSVRGEANMHFLGEDKKKYQDIVDDYRERQRWLAAAGIVAWPTKDERNAMAILDDIAAIEKSMREQDGDTRHLIVWDPLTGEKGHTKSHAAISIGNVDEADYVSTFVPGLNTTVHGNMVGYTNQLQDLQNRSEQLLKEAGTPGKVATIMWQGYDTPGFTTVASTARAEAGGALLRPFLEGIADSRDANSSSVPSQALLTHSYGSTTGSAGMQDVRPGVVDKFVLFGSPGYVTSAAHGALFSGAPLTEHPGSWNFNIDPGNTYAMRYGTDVINATQGVLGVDPMDDPNIKHLEIGPSKYQSDFTVTPGNYEYAAEQYLVQRFNDSVDTHGEYLESGTQAQEYLAQITAGMEP